MANNTGKKFGGRQKATPNVLKKEVRAVLKAVVLVWLRFDTLGSFVPILCQ